MPRLKRSLSWLLLAALLLQIFSPLAPARVYAAPASRPAGLQAGTLGIAQTETSQSIQVLFIYNTDTPAAEDAATLLEANGAAVNLRQLGEDSEPPQPNLFVPAINQGEGATSSQHIAQDSDLEEYDVIILGDDLETDGALMMDASLQQEILDSGRPVIGMGRGGARFLQENSVLPSANVGTTTASQVNLCDSGAGTPLFQGENSLPLDQPAYMLYNEGQPTVYNDMQERMVKTARLACAESSASQVALLLLQERFALWGFAGAPSQMTETGQALFANLLWLLVGENVEIPLATGGIRPEPGIEQELLDALLEGDPQYALIQFYRLPTEEEQETLAEVGIELLSYLAQNTYSANIRPDANFDHPLVQDLLRFAGIYKPEYKVSPTLSDESGQALENVLVVFFDNISAEQAIGVLQSIFGETYSQGATTSEWYVPNNAEQVQSLAQSKLVRYIVPVVPPDELNENARPVVQTDAVQAANIAGGSATYLGMSGQGVTLGIFEGRPLLNHGDMDGRIIEGAHASAGTSSHATHVSGIMIGDGAISAAQGLGDFERRGHAPQAMLVTQGSAVSPSSGDGYTERFADSVINHDVFAHNHSYVQSYGDYDGTATTVDQIVRGDATDDGTPIPPSLAIYAAGNNGQGAQYGNIVGFYSVFTTAKNSLSVGSTDTDTGEKSDFSSKGPTYDGRIKPDVVAPGCRDSSTSPSTGIMSPDTANGDTYGGKCGTSMAAPVVTGIAGLMLQQYRNTFGPAFSPMPSSLKAILVNTAVDQVDTSIYNDPDCNCAYDFGVGPDWATGYGLVNAPAALATIRARNIIEDQVAPANTVDTYTIQVTAGRPQLRFTLAWDDEAGDTSTSQTTRKLVNDLDLVLIDPDGNEHFPWVLDPLPVTDDPTASGSDPIDQNDINNNPAFRDVNDRDNVEQVLVDNPMAGTWEIRVTASALPNANPQPYSLAGDFRELNIFRPTTSQVADAGDPANPNVILVRLSVEQPYATPTTSAFTDADAGDFTVEINGTPADVINGLAVGDQFWLNVRPAAGTYSAGSKYDLTVTWTGYGADSKTRAVLFTEREVTDRSIVVDYSGSMSGYDKMVAAQNAARLFIDQSLPGDRVGVVGFSTSTVEPYAITEVSNDPLTPELNAAKNGVDTLAPTNLTAIGLGMLDGHAQVTSAPADSSLVDVVILLSDGMENVNPYYDTPAVKGVIEPTDTIVHTVGVGPSNAGFFSLLEDIADDNDGIFFSVTETTPGGGGAGIAAADASNAIGLNAQPFRLPNRLGDAYKAIAEDVLMENRLYQATGMADPKERPKEQWRFDVPKGSKRLNVSLNWDDPDQHIRLRLRTPDTMTFYEYNPKESKDATCRGDLTHQVCIVENPQPGVWLVEAFFETSGNQHEYVMWASAQTPVQFHMHIGTPPEQRLPGEPIHLVGFVHQNGKPLPGPDTAVIVKVFDPQNNDLMGEIKLVDDGMNQDGMAGDGIFGGTFMAPNQPGPYQVRGLAKGTNTENSAFELMDYTGFQLRPRVLYVHQDDRETTAEVESWLKANGIPVDSVHKLLLPAVQDIRSKYALAIIGPDTAEWNSEQAGNLIESEIRTLSLGKGGVSYLQLAQIAAPQSGEGSTIGIGDYGDDVWFSDYEFNIQDQKVLQLYEERTARYDFPEKTPGISAVFGTNPNDGRLATILMFNSFWTFWGFQDGPQNMTETGRQLFINTVQRAMR